MQVTTYQIPLYFTIVASVTCGKVATWTMMKIVISRIRQHQTFMWSTSTNHEMPAVGMYMHNSTNYHQPCKPKQEAVLSYTRAVQICNQEQYKLHMNGTNS